MNDLSKFLLEGGGVVAGGAAVGSGGAWVLASVVNDFRDDDAKVDVMDWFQRGGGLGAVFGFATLVFDAVGLGP